MIKLKAKSFSFRLLAYLQSLFNIAEASLTHEKKIQKKYFGEIQIKEKFNKDFLEDEKFTSTDFYLDEESKKKLFDSFLQRSVKLSKEKKNYNHEEFSELF